LGGGLLYWYGASAPAVELSWKINEQTAERLAAEAYGHGSQDFNNGPGMSSPFFVFYGLNAPPANGGFGYFAVNPWTGDVWGLWAAINCRRLPCADRKPRFGAASPP